LLFISPHPLYQLLGITQEVVSYHPTNGRVLGTTPGINAEFFHGGAASWAIEQALSNPAFRGAWGGLPDGVDYRAYVSTFDTDTEAERLGWDDDTKEYVEQFLLSYQDYGRSYILAVPPQEVADLPWPTFNETHHARIVIVAKEIGADLVKALEYERTHKARPFVIEALEQALAENPQPDSELVVA
jgi:hypothetical protein